VCSNAGILLGILIFLSGGFPHSLLLSNVFKYFTKAFKHSVPGGDFLRIRFEYCQKGEYGLFCGNEATFLKRIHTYNIQGNANLKPSLPITSICNYLRIVIKY
jgi:hypothetical protein